MEPVATWTVRGGTTLAPSDVVLLPAARQPCNHQCPWLESNHGRVADLEYDHEVPDIPMACEPYAFEPWKRVRVWERDLRDGGPDYGSVCHVRRAGTHERADGSWHVVARQCTGALVMQHRELLRHLEHGSSALSASGAARVAESLLGRPVAEADLDGLDVDEVRALLHPALLDERIGCDAVAPALTSEERQTWSRRSGREEDA